MPATKKTARAASDVFSAEEKAAMKELVRERKASGNKAAAEADCLAKIAEMAPADRDMAERLHEIIKANAPDLAAKTWYGMPAYAKDGNVVCFFQSAGKFKARYATLGFTDKANIDEGEMWPTYYGIKKLTNADAEKIAKLIKRAVSSGAHAARTMSGGLRRQRLAKAFLMLAVSVVASACGTSESGSTGATTSQGHIHGTFMLTAGPVPSCSPETACPSAYRQPEQGKAITVTKPDGTIVASTVTSSAGVFDVDVPAGRYTVATPPQNQPGIYRAEVSVQPGATVDVSLEITEP